MDIFLIVCNIYYSPWWRTLPAAKSRNFTRKYQLQNTQLQLVYSVTECLDYFRGFFKTKLTFNQMQLLRRILLSYEVIWLVRIYFYDVCNLRMHFNLLSFDYILFLLLIDGIFRHFIFVTINLSFSQVFTLKISQVLCRNS